MSDCEQCAALQRQNDFLANDRDGYVQSLTDENNKLRAEVEKFKMSLSDVVQQTQEQADTITALRAENERLNKSRNKWGQKYNKLLEKHKVTLSQLKTAVWSDSEECKLLNAENEKLRAVLGDIHAAAGNNHLIANIARAALEEGRT